MCCIILITVTSAGSNGRVFKFNSTLSTTSNNTNKRCKETPERWKSYNARNLAKKKLLKYKPYTGEEH